MVDVAKEIEKGSVVFYTVSGTTVFYFAVVNQKQSDARLPETSRHVIGIRPEGFVIVENENWASDGWEILPGITPQQFYEVLHSLREEKDNVETDRR